MELAPTLKKKCILIVDDQEYLRQMIKTSLGSHGFTNLIEARDGEKASRIMQTNNIDLVISDWEMPNMDGLGLYGVMQQEEKSKTTPFILLTKHGDKEKVTEAIKTGITNYVVKPFTPDVIINKVIELLQ